MLGISPDPVDKLKRWHDKEKFGYDLLSDPDHTILEKYGAWGEKKLYGKTYHGVIRSHWIRGLIPLGSTKLTSTNIKK